MKSAVELVCDSLMFITVYISCLILEIIDFLTFVISTALYKSKSNDGFVLWKKRQEKRKKNKRCI